jgi:hypothetical protein
MTSQTQTASQIDLTKLAAAIESTKRAAALWAVPVDLTHLDGLLAYEMGREAARQGVDYFDCPLTDHECRMRWADGHNSRREIAW